MPPLRILVTGATGYVGGRLIPLLLEAGHRVRVLVRDPRRVANRPWASQVEVFQGNVLRPQTIAPALRDIDVAYYLIHSLQAGWDYSWRDRKAAENFAEAAAGKLRHVIYLGGLQPHVSRFRASRHLRSRAQTGEILSSRLPVTEFRAGPIIGSGSASFEMVRYLTERLPFMPAPRWVHHRISPIAIRDVLAYLVQALDIEPAGTVEIGCAPLTFADMVQEFARVRGLRPRVIKSVPFIGPRLASLWVGLLSPIPIVIAGPIFQGMSHSLVAETQRARQLFPAIEPMPYFRAVERALDRIRLGDIATRWSGALAGRPTVELSDREGLIQEVRSVFVDAPPDEVFQSVTSIGGDRGWLVWEWAWEARGLLDRLVGGPGLRRGRRHPTQLLPGEALDFWRVEIVDPPKLLRLRAEMKVPGYAWIQWQCIPESGGTRLIQTAMFAPRGLGGAAYWYSLYPLHKRIFSDLVAAIARGTRLRPERHA